MMEKLEKVNKVMENICTNSNEHCQFCKIMNTTQ